MPDDPSLFHRDPNYVEPSEAELRAEAQASSDCELAVIDRMYKDLSSASPRLNDWAIELKLQALESPEHVALVAEWSECLSAQGFSGYQNQTALVNDLVARLSQAFPEFGPYYPQPGEEAYDALVADPRFKELLAYEEAVLTALASCMPAYYEGKYALTEAAVREALEGEQGVWLLAELNSE